MSQSPGMDRRVLLHIGTHKTGTTSLQQLLRDESSGALARAGAAFPVGCLDAQPNNHVELHALAMRADRDSPVRMRWPVTRDAHWLRAAERRVRQTVVASDARCLVYSAEGLSYLRYVDELERLTSLLSGRSLEVVMFVREPGAFLESYAHNLRLLGIARSTDPDSIAYLERDTWLVDYDARIDLWTRAVRPGSVTVIDYDDTMARDGSIIPAFASLIGIAPDALPDLSSYFLNRRDGTPQSRA